MNKVRDRASLHPKTVSNYQAHIRKRRAPSIRPGGRYRIKVDPRVWRVAKRLAAGDMRRLVICSATEVVVRNP
jgi:hypothetical protein